ncbi:MAG TPA: hypothetical protein VGE26_02390 [Sphingobacteriaceae bacterium]
MKKLSEALTEHNTQINCHSPALQSSPDPRDWECKSRIFFHSVQGYGKINMAKQDTTMKINQLIFIAAEAAKIQHEEKRPASP